MMSRRVSRRMLVGWCLYHERSITHLQAIRKRCMSRRSCPYFRLLGEPLTDSGPGDGNKEKETGEQAREDQDDTEPGATGLGTKEMEGKPWTCPRIKNDCENNAATQTSLP